MKIWDQLKGIIVVGDGVVDGELVGDEEEVKSSTFSMLDDPPPLPTYVTAEIRANMAMEQVSLAVGRLSDQIFREDRGSMEYDGISDTYICYLEPTEEDKAAVGPLFSQALEVWMVVDAHTKDETLVPNHYGWDL